MEVSIEIRGNGNTEMELRFPSETLMNVLAEGPPKKVLGALLNKENKKVRRLHLTDGGILWIHKDVVSLDSNRSYVSLPLPREMRKRMITELRKAANKTLYSLSLEGPSSSMVSLSHFPP